MARTMGGRAAGQDAGKSLYMQQPHDKSNVPLSRTNSRLRADPAPTEDEVYRWEGLGMKGVGGTTGTCAHICKGTE